MSDPAAPTTPQWIIRPFQLTTPFLLKGELEYQSWDDLERTLTGDLEFESLPQLHFEFGQEVSRVQGGLGIQLIKRELPHIGPWVTEIGLGAMLSWGGDHDLELNPSIELRNERWPWLSFTIEGAMTLSGVNTGGQPELGGEISGGLTVKFDLIAPRGTYRKRQ